MDVICGKLGGKFHFPHCPPWFTFIPIFPFRYKILTRNFLHELQQEILSSRLIVHALIYQLSILTLSLSFSLRSFIPSVIVKMQNV